jgi:type IV pilus assembly protein PilC
VIGGSTAPDAAPITDPLATPSDRDEQQPFRYRAVDETGTIQEGHLNADSEADALARLRQQGLRTISLTLHGPSVLEREFSVPGLGPRVKGSELAVFTRQFATMVQAGVPLLRTIEVLRRQTENKLLADTLDQMRLSVEAGSSLSDAVARHPRVFDRLFVAMIRTGESSGALDTVLRQLADTMAKSVATRQKIRSALTYPAAVMLMVVGVIVIMLVFVVPTFAGVYDDLGGTLPLPTRILVGVSDVFRSQLPLVVLTGIGLLLTVRRWLRTPSGRRRWHAIKLRLPLIGHLFHHLAIARFGRTMAVLTRSGVPVLETLRITAGTVGNAVVAHALDDTRQAVLGGEPLADNLARNKVFPAMVVQLVAVGEETGTLDQMLEIVGQSFEDEVETAVAGLAALVEPLMMAVIGVVVGGIVVALYLPMFRLIDLIQ